MSDATLAVATGWNARRTLCRAFDNARTSIEAEFYSISDKAVVASLNAAARRHVRVEVHVEAHPDRYRTSRQQSGGQWDLARTRLLERLRRLFSPAVHVVLEDDPRRLLHAKAAVVDGRNAYIATANPTWCGFAHAGAVLVRDSAPRDVAAVEKALHHKVAGRPGPYVVAGPAGATRAAVDRILASPHNARIAVEDLSDRQVVTDLVRRRRAGHHDRIVLQEPHTTSAAQKWALTRLEHAGVGVRTMPCGTLHDKYVDGGDEIYVGSGNLTRNGLDEAREVDVIAPARAFGSGARLLRNEFDALWRTASQSTAPARGSAT